MCLLPLESVLKQWGCAFLCGVTVQSLRKPHKHPVEGGGGELPVHLCFDCTPALAQGKVPVAPGHLLPSN